MKTHIINDESAISIDVISEFTPNPTGATTPQYALTAVGTNSPTGWASGAWTSTPEVVTRAGQTMWRVTGTTPTIGGAGTLAVTAGTSRWLWQKVVVGSETFVDCVATIVVP